MIDGNKTPPLPDKPTDAQPGSKEKIAVMGARAASGQQIFHPEDRNVFAEPACYVK